MFPPKGTNALVVHEEQDSCFKWPFSPVRDFQWALWKLKGETMVEGGEVRLMRQLTVLAWLRWWWSPVISRPWPPHPFRAAGGGVSLLPTATSINRSHETCNTQKRAVTARCFLILHSFCQFFHWFNTCDGDICLEVSSLPQKHLLNSVLCYDWCTPLALV